MEKIERDLAQVAGINVSEVCRRAIRHELGLVLQENVTIPKNMVDQYFEILDARMRQDSEMFAAVKEYVGRVSAEEEEATERISQISDALSNVVNGNSEYYRRRLPEHDPHGDATEVWDQLQRVIAHKYGVEISLNELHDHFRRTRPCAD